jgi:inorganic phosphate transporter, PiT family
MALGVSLAGMFAGFFIAGQTMFGSVLGKLVSKSLPTSGLLSALVVSVGVLFVLTLLELPVSLSNCTVGAFVGAALASSTKINSANLVVIVASWVIVPFGCALLSFVIYEIASRAEQKQSLVSVVRANRLILVAVVFFVSFMLGANNLGLIESFAVPSTQNSLVLGLLELLLFAAAAAGIILFGKILASVVGEKIVGLSQMKTFAAMLSAAIVIFILTLFSIPVSLTQVIIGGMLGAGISRRPWAVNSREIGELIAGWALVTVICAGLGFALSTVV